MICLVPDSIAGIHRRFAVAAIEAREFAACRGGSGLSMVLVWGSLHFPSGGGTRHHLLVVTEWSTHSRHWKFKYQRVGRFTVEIDQYLP
jgi:hypothetical protein